MEQLAGIVRSHLVDDSVNKVIVKVLGADLIIIDDIGLLAVTGDMAESLCRWLHAAYEKCSITLSTVMVDRL
ncbi:hypothetical protein [Glutamicibacter arilaitensis]|uniref:hypothetical protein n=1 Tax=Glutamicibacter arilaitensis TaxID=256701 RepID=UPI00384F9BE4